MANNEEIKLDYPVEHNGAKYATIKMRRWKVKDMRRAQEKKGISDAEREINLFADLCEISPDVIEELDGSDYSKLKERFESFSG